MKNIFVIILCLTFLGCEAIGDLFHGERPEPPLVTYTVTFDANGATGGNAPAKIVVEAGAVIQLPSIGNMVKTGHTFIAWSESATNGVGTSYFIGDSIPVNGNITLYARWSIVEMVQIPGGTFTMGSNDSTDWNAQPAHHVILTDSFYIGIYVLTQEQWQTVMETNPSYFQGTSDDRIVTSGEIQIRRPVDCVSWYDTIVFCNRLSIQEGLTPAYRISGSTNPNDWGNIPTSSNSTWNAVEIVSGSRGYRLPTEAQWEYACRAETTTIWSYGNTMNGDYMWFYPNGNNRTHEIGKKMPNAWGLYDMHGNVWEWCWDRYSTYTGGVQTNPSGASSGSDRIIRGGAFDSSGPNTRLALRSSYSPDYKSSNFGFRLVRPE